MNRMELHNLYVKLEEATIAKALADKRYEDMLQAFMNEIMTHYPIATRNKPE